MMRYDVLHDYAQRNKLDYNELCRVMREATATPLTDDQIDTLYVSKLAGKGFDNIAVAFRAMVRAVERAHGIDGVNAAPAPTWHCDNAEQGKPRCVKPCGYWGGSGNPVCAISTCTGGVKASDGKGICTKDADGSPGGGE